MTSFDDMSDAAKAVLGCVIVLLFGIVGAALLADLFGVLTQ